MKETLADGIRPVNTTAEQVRVKVCPAVEEPLDEIVTTGSGGAARGRKQPILCSNYNALHMYSRRTGTMVIPSPWSLAVTNRFCPDI